MYMYGNIYVYIFNRGNVYRGTESENVREDDDICVALYNNLFQQVITVHRSGVVMVHLLEVTR